MSRDYTFHVDRSVNEAVYETLEQAGFEIESVDGPVVDFAIYKHNSQE